MTLLVKLHQPNSAKTLYNDVVYVDGEPDFGLILKIRAEDDHSHYGDRARGWMRNLAGVIHPRTHKALYKIKKVLVEEVDDI